MSDLISRQDAIDFIDAGRLCNPNEPRWSDNEIVNFLKCRPSVGPHGRLIDADALVNTVYYTNISESVKEFIADLIGIAPTVIEAEEG